MTTPSIASVLPLAPGHWAVDHNHSSIGFTIRHFGVSKVRGRFMRFETDVLIGATLESTSIATTIDLSSVDTGNADRDAHVRAADMLDVENRPTMEFRSTRVTGAGSDWRVDGVLTIGGVSRSLELAVEFGGVQDFPDGTRHAGFEAAGELRRSDFGLDLGLPPGVGGALLSDVVKFELDIQLVEPQS